VFQPGADLGIVGGVQTAAALAVAMLWPSTETRLLPRTGAAVTVLLLGASAFVVMPYVVEPAVSGVVILALLGLVVAASVVALLAILELLHRMLSDQTAVQVLTVLDVVESTSLQAALFVGGMLISFSSRTSWGRVDAYRIFVLGVAAAAAGALTWVRRRIGTEHL
jgi:hypothetical protein